jgi:hypothetical protein
MYPVFWMGIHTVAAGWNITEAINLISISITNNKNVISFSQTIFLSYLLNDLTSVW